MNLLDAARQALEEWHTEPGSVRMASLMIALRQAIEQAQQQEPIGYVNPRWAFEMQQGRLPYTWLHAQPDAEGAVAVYITPPQRKPEPPHTTHWDGCDAVHPECRKPEQAEQQEPVALPCCGYTNASAIKWNPYNQVVQCHNCGQVYAAPPQRKPLTDEEADELIRRFARYELLRAIERAHGITGETNE